MMTPFDVAIKAAVDAATAQSATLRFGDVTAVTGTSITVEIAGATVPNVPIMRPFGTATPTPQVGDRVWLLHQGALMVCIGTSA